MLTQTSKRFWMNKLLPQAKEFFKLIVVCEIERDMDN